MGIDFKKALTYVFKDESWKKKFVLLTMLMFISNLSIILNHNFILNIPIFVFVAGFYILLINNLITEKLPVLPDFNIKSIFKTGLKYYGIIAILFSILASISIVFLVFQFAVLFFTSILAKLHLVSNINSLNIVMTAETCIWGIIFFAVFLFFYIVLTFSRFLFSENLSFKEAFNIKKCISAFFKNWGIYLLLFLLFLLIYIPLGIFYEISFIYDNKAILILALLLSSPINVFIAFLDTNLIVQAYKQSLAKIESDDYKLENLKHPFNSFDIKVIVLMACISLLSILAIFSMPFSESSSTGRLLVQFNNRKVPGYYEFYYHQGCQIDRYKLNKPVLFPIIKNGKYGYIDKTGKIIIQPKFVYAEDFYNGLALVNVGGTSKNPALYQNNIIGGKYGYINTKGDFVIKPVFDNAYRFNNEKTTWVKVGTEYKYIDRTGKYVKNSESNFTEGLSKVKLGKKYGFMDKTGNIVINPTYDKVFDFSDGLARVEKNGKMGAINTKGQVIIDIKYDYLFDFREGLATVVVNNKYGFINKEGKIVISPMFKDACSFSEGLVDARDSNMKVGYIDKTGNFIVKPQYDGNYGFVNGMAPVEIKGKWGYIDKKGNYIWKPTN